MKKDMEAACSVSDASFVLAYGLERVMMNAKRNRRGFTMDGVCLLCSGFVEDIDHL